jgi:hypothetical protein
MVAKGGVVVDRIWRVGGVDVSTASNGKATTIPCSKEQARVIHRTKQPTSMVDASESIFALCTLEASCIKTTQQS